jgi:ATP-binding cassette subfamily B protein
MEQMKWIWNYMKGRRAFFIFGIILTAFTAGMRVINPMLAQKIIDDVITPHNPTALIPLLATMMIVQMIRLCLGYFRIILMEKASTKVMTDVRRDMYDNVQWQDFHFLGRFPTGNLMTRMTHDLEMVRHSTAWVSYQFVEAVILFISVLTFLVFINWKLALCQAAITPFILFISYRYKKRLRPRLKFLRKKLTDLGTVVSENIGGNRVVKAFAREEYEKDHFETFNADFRNTSCENALIVAKYQPMLEIASQLIIVVTLLAGGYFLIKGAMTHGQYYAFSSLTWALSFPMQMLGPLLADIERFTVASKMCCEVLDAPLGIVNTAGAIDLTQNTRGVIEFNNVSLSIDGTPVLDNISFKAEAGATIGILGSTGAGKTSLVNLLSRFHEPDKGTVLLDGVDIKNYTLSSLRRRVGVAMQDVFLFSDSVKGNIAYGRPKLDEGIIRKHAAQADADSFISDMSEGYNTLVGERGVGLSGGQRQRIALARALAIEPSVLVLDDTTSSVDSETEKYIQERLTNLDFICTKIIIAQRISSFRNADMILVMDKGLIIERGTHSQLLEKRGFYHYIWQLQNNGVSNGH